MLSELDSLLNKLLDQKPELTKAEVEDKIRQKKDKIGAGYLTDQGALFLIAGDYGISLTETKKTELSLKDLYAGAKDIQLTARVLSVTPTKNLTRKDGSPLHLRIITVYDADSSVDVKVWDDSAKLPVFETMKPGDLIKVEKAYVKSEFDGSLAIHMGTGASVEAVENDTGNTIPGIDSITKDVSELQKDDKNVAVTGINDGLINEIRFTSNKGIPGKALKMRLKGKDGTTALRVVLWGKDESSIPNIVSSTAKVKLIGVKVKATETDMEIHGNEGTVIEIEGSKDVEPVIAKVLAKTQTDDGKNLILAVDKDRKIFNITDISNITGDMCAQGDAIECMPTKIYGNSMTLDESSFVRKLEGDDSAGTLPTVGELRTKINDISADITCCLEGIVLKVSERREIQTKSGETVSLSEMFIEDDTGQIWVKGWRDKAREVDSCQLGEIISVIGISARPGYEGKLELTLNPFSKIIKKS